MDKTNLMCKLLGHNEEQIEDYKIDDEIIITDGIKAKQFAFPVVMHQYKCKRCKAIRQSNPDVIGSMDGRYVVHYI